MRLDWAALQRAFMLTRVFIGSYMLATGWARILTGNTASGQVNMFSARVFGLMLVLAGAFLLATVTRRCSPRGRSAAILAAGAWLLLVADAWASGAWVSITGAAVYILALTNEVLAHEC